VNAESEMTGQIQKLPSLRKFLGIYLDETEEKHEKPYSGKPVSPHEIV
jgi:hypothetical protein